MGDTILISGPTTGNQELILEKMMVNGQEKTTAKAGDKVTFEVPFRIRLSDKLFKILKNYCVIDFNRINVSHAFTIQGFKNLVLTPIDLPGKSPPYSPYRHNLKQGANTALIILDQLTQKTFFYAPAIAQFDERLFQSMNNADCVLIDGTFWHEDEMSRCGINNKLATEMGHCALASEEGLLSKLNALQKPRKIVIHVNNTNPILNTTSPEHAQLNNANIEIAYDGMNILL